MKPVFTAGVLACTLFAACALPASAQTIKPGLWDLSSQFSSPDKQVQSAMNAAQQTMQNMSPEQRAQMETLLRQNGVQLDIGSGGAVRTKVCVTREMAERKEFPMQRGDCTQKYTQLPGNRGSIAFSCSKPKVSGQGEIAMVSDTSYRANMRVTSEQQGHSQVVDTNVTGTWVGADCGGLKPVAAGK
ncbi:DUF3617 domain-containing protein [Massilia sp. YIM B02763]|uniref:DUF3617 domain-containing protein n=1 Tax=Massilia sp. YIM B02763 TaxID=3050130 RepID=UPI0025B7159E|nr:DUF3617 domain-containing protein [Massilia sp. YIM B02763]MDN4052230.1 DUF3617 domain-containing protein [Massilia sp. YIM B02763]